MTTKTKTPLDQLDDGTLVRFERYGDAGWQWAVKETQFDPDAGDFVAVAVAHRTDDAGTGRWSLQPDGWTRDADGVERTVYSWKQDRGTCDFWLHTARKPARARLVRLLAAEYAY